MRYLTCGVCQLNTHAKRYYRLGSDEATYYETHSSDWRCQDCGGPQRHADCALSDENMIQRFYGPRLSNLSDAGLRPISGGLHYFGRGDGAGATPSPPPSFHHLRAFSLPALIRDPLNLLTTCAHSRCLRPYTSPHKQRKTK